MKKEYLESVLNMHCMIGQHTEYQSYFRKDINLTNTEIATGLKILEINRKNNCLAKNRKENLTVRFSMDNTIRNILMGLYGKEGHKLLEMYEIRLAIETMKEFIEDYKFYTCFTKLWCCGQEYQLLVGSNYTDLSLKNHDLFSAVRLKGDYIWDDFDYLNFEKLTNREKKLTKYWLHTQKEQLKSQTIKQ